MLCLLSTTNQNMAEYERIALVKPEVFVYQLPPRATTRVVRAADWDLANPSWKGRLKVLSKGNSCTVRLEDRSGDLFASCPIDAHPGVAVEPVSDSSRYFVLRLLDPSGRHAFVGLGFEDRGDAFDFNVSLQDHFKQVKQSETIAQEEAGPLQHKDYSLKEGQKITINIAKKSGDADADADKGSSQGASIGLTAGGVLCPPPSGGVVRPLNPPPQPTKSSGKDDWGDFTSFGSDSTNTSSNDSNNAGGGNWVQF